MDEVLSEKQPCDYVECPHFGEWTLWGECDTLCPRRGIRSRARNCNFGEANVSEECMGETTEYEECFHSDCAYWAEWTQWSICSKSCGVGEHLRYRECKNGEIGDLNCNVNEDVDIMLCSTEECPHWSEWSKSGFDFFIFSSLLSRLKKNYKIFETLIKVESVSG